MEALEIKELEQQLDSDLLFPQKELVELKREHILIYQEKIEVANKILLAYDTYNQTKHFEDYIQIKRLEGLKDIIKDRLTLNQEKMSLLKEEVKEIKNKRQLLFAEAMILVCKERMHKDEFMSMCYRAREIINNAGLVNENSLYD